MNEIILLVVPIVIIILSVCQKTKTYKSLTNIFYYSKYISLFIPFILIYLKPDLKNKMMSFFYEIDNKPLYQNMNDLMSSYMDTKKNSRRNNCMNNHTNFNNNHTNFNNNHTNFNNNHQNNRMQMNNRMNMINPNNFIPPQNKKSNRHKRNVSESKKKYIASNQKWHCTHCNQILDNTFEVDHIIPLYKGGTNDLNNLEALCRNCHGVKTFKDNLGI